jgi:transglutaminase superfamily protein
MTPYALANHVFVCLQDEHVVLLDVRNDRYFALEAAKTRGLDVLVRGWPVRADGTATSLKDLSDSGVLEVLAERGLLTRGKPAGKDATPIQCSVAEDEIDADDTAERPKISLLHIVRFSVAAIAAHLSLKYLPFERVVRQAQWRRMHARARFGTFALDRERTQTLIAIFSWLRPFFFTAKDACLFEALALSRFLASHGIYPQWVFGVQARPFSAHCWLQHGGVVLNDTVEHVGQYTPIMLV